MKLNLEFKRRRTPTLIAWWRELNSWRWPKEIPDPEPPDAPDNPHRNRVMADIERELGRRTVFARKS